MITKSYKILAIFAISILIDMHGVRGTHPLVRSPCQNGTQCLEGGWEYCHVEKGASKTETDGVCKHKDVFPLLQLEFWGFLAVIAILWITNVAGIGGGGTVVPILMIFMRFDAKNSIALSNFSIFLSSLIRYIINSSQPHPLKNGTGILVDMNLAILMLPLIISGVSIGVILNILMPNIIIIASYALALIYFGYGITKKALALYRKEVARDKEMEEAKKEGGEHEMDEAEKEGGEGEMVPGGAVIGGGKNTSKQPDKKEFNIGDQFVPDILSMENSPQRQVEQNNESVNTATVMKVAADEKEKDGPPEMNEKLKAIIAYESTNLQWSRLALNWGLIVVLIILSVLKGADKEEDSVLGILKCDAVDWTLFVVLQLICLIFLGIGVFLLYKDFQERTAAGYQFIEGDLEANPKNLTNMIMISFFGAIFAAFSGLGPGMIFSPALIIIGIESRVATATGMYLTMFTTLAATIQVMVFNKINMEYALYIQVMTVIGSFLGLFFQRYIVQRYNRVSYTNFFFVSAIIFAFFASIIINIPILVHKSELGEDIAVFTDYCPKSAK